MTTHLVFLSVLLIACGCLGCDAPNRNEGGAAATPTAFTTLAEKGITAFIDRPVVLTATVSWQHHDISLPEDPRTPQQIARKAGPLLVLIGPDDAPPFKDLRPSRRHLRAGGPAVRIVVGADGRETYAVGDQTLKASGRYRLEATLRLRAGFDQELLDNPAFVKQTNDPRYWSQTLELELHAAEPVAGG